MSRIQNILEKAEREGATLRTSRMAVPAAAGGIGDLSPVPDTPPVHGRAAAEFTAEPAAEPPAALRSSSPPGGVGSLARESDQPPAVDLDAAAPRTAMRCRLHPVLVAGLAPKSLAAEQYRALRTRLAHTEGATAMRIIMITSPQKGEGKSVTSANLALTMAQELQRKVVLVEADLRKPSLQRLFGLPDGPGLSEYLVGAAELKDVVQVLPEYNLTVIPGGTAPTNPAELLGSTAMRRMLDQLRSRFDRVIVDTPPVLPLADVAVLAPIVDGTLLVVRVGVTPKPAIENALRAFDSSRLLGVVLNESGMEQDYRYDGPRH
jgi:capsular exopolysaccharide synthesis family protein